MRVLITGGNGMIGSALKRIGTAVVFTISSPTRKDLDLESEDVTLRYIDANSLAGDTKSGNEPRIGSYLSSEKRKIIDG